MTTSPGKLNEFNHAEAPARRLLERPGWGRSMQITVEPSDWGDARLADIEVLLADVGSHLVRLFREPITETLEIVTAPAHDHTPRTLNRTTRSGPITIQLTARDKKWDQFAYQFSHEICHALSNSERLYGNPNNWFHEAICELASVFVLRRMAECWVTRPPYPNWDNYAESLYSYAKEYLDQPDRQLPAGATLSTWLASEEGSLRKDCEQRDKNAVVAYQLLPIFESDPAGWNAFRNLPNSSGMFEGYLRDWYSQVESIDKPFVNRIIQLFRE